MLQNIRDRFTGAFAIVLLVLLGFSFIFFGINLPFMGGGYAAKVEGVEIATQQFENAYQAELSRFVQMGGELRPEIRQLVRRGVLENLIRETLLDVYLAESGYRITNQMITDLIQQAPEFQVDGKFSKDQYYTWLEARALTPASFEANQRQALRLRQFQRGLGATSFVTPAEYRSYLNLYGQRRRAAIAIFDVDAVTDEVTVSDEEVRAWYENNPSEFQTPESVDLQYVAVDRGDLTDSIELSEEEVQAYYRDSANRYLQDERRQASHILIPFGDDEDAAEEQARALAERARAGEPFAELARQHSADGGTAEQGGDLGTATRSQLPAALADPVFSLREGEIAGPVRSDFGFHVIKLGEITTGGPLPLDQVRTELERELRDQKVESRYRELERKLSDALFDAESMASLAESVGLELKTASGFTRNGGEPFGSNQAVIDAVFAPGVFDEGMISDIVELDANRSAVFKVTQHHPAAQQPLEQVREQIAATLRSQKALEIVRQRAQQLEERLRAGADLVAAAQEAGAEVQPSATYARQSEDADPRVLEAIFRVGKPTDDQPTIGNAVSDEGDYAVFSVSAVAPGRPETIPLAERDAGKLQLAQESGAADYTAFVLELERTADIVRSEDALAEPDF